MAQGFHADSCSMMAQTSAGSSGCSSLGVAVAVQVHKSNEGRFVEFNSLLGGDFLQRVVDVRQMIRGDIANKGAGDFVIAHAAVQPAEEQDKLHASAKDGRQNAVPMGGHGIPLECGGLPPLFPW